MTFLKSVFIAFSMFSTLPTPQVDWNEKNMRYMMCAFPFVGLVIAFLCGAWFLFGLQIVFVWQKAIPHQIMALIFMLIPIFITGGIHMDGFMDTSDALASHADRDKKLEILKDSHSGAFAVMACVLYFISYYVLSCHFYQIYYSQDSLKRFPSLFSQFMASLPILSIFVMSRSLSAFAVAAFPIAKNSGLLHTFSSSSAKYFTAMWSEFLFMVVSILLFRYYGLSGAALVLTSLLVFLAYFIMAKKNFGGITGDTAGWFVQLCELFCLAEFLLFPILF
ncbi:MAG: adenosylcobinamide-GDP ribazoletransferase [Treponema sp.]|nr:adenosylcobinamide-GDP ribazoletransferase [Treponema sp.]